MIGTDRITFRGRDATFCYTACRIPYGWNL